ncbi:MAG: glycosyltransferase [Gammaproteobacteria bacterium]|nr:glycosyltransferase [Gammaproteobacteria bacterium]MCW8927952.1 glycosyltransferase [Gammaproteobacteria bacterium]MCW8972087.1 glycosyltransferase [Gammaproteobacteria bacterium]MCW8993600.1 glycosyltransferase [Gammaproteobacteria bacterium]
MRIIMVSDVYFPRVNGVSSSIRTFRRELTALGHEVLLLAPDYGESSDDESWIIRVPSRRVPGDPEDRMMRYHEVLALEGKLRELQPDLLHIQTPFIAHYAGVRLARRLRLPVVLTYHTYFEEYLFHYIPLLPRFFLRWMVRSLSRRQCSQVDSVVVPTDAFSEVLRGYGVREELYINPTGIELQRFSRGDGERFRREHSIAPQRPTLLFVGRLVQEKNIDFLLRMLQQVCRRSPEALLLLAGEGLAETMLRQEAAIRGLQENVRFAGYFHSQQALCDCYAAADVFVFASRTETQGLVLLEAMAMGVPVVSTARMGTVDVLREAHGAVVVEEDETAFAAAVIRLLEDAALRQRLGTRGREDAANWSAEAMALRLESLYLETAGSIYLFGREIRTNA